MNYTQSIGNIVELQCIAKFMELGYECSVPYGNGAKYDFIADVNGQMLRIQCKSCINPKRSSSAEPDENAIQITTVAQTTNTQKTTRHLYTKEQIDYFATWYKGKVYLIPVEECSTSKTLRFAPPSNNNQNYNKAENYEIENVIKPSKDYVDSKKVYMEVQRNSIKNFKEKQLYCINCNKEITIYSKSGLCPECYSITQRKTERPSREELKDMIRNNSFLSLSKKFNVSDNAIRKWCKSMNLPSAKAEINSYTDEEWRAI